MKIVYISGAFVGDGTKAAIERNIEAARQYAKALANKKIAFFSPHLNNVERDGGDVNENQRFYYQQDVEFLTRSDAVLFIPGWGKSFGARQEEKIAEELGLPLFYPKSTDDLQELESWYFKEDATQEKKAIDWKKVIELKSALAKYEFKKASA